MYDKTADLYDKVYSYKDYPAEARALSAFIRRELRSGGNRLLDVACGTGLHVECLAAEWQVEGVDLSAEMLARARARNPGVPFHQADMVNFELGRRFDAVTCLFSSIGYMQTLERLGQAIACMGRHLVPGGVLAVEPWFTPADWHPGTVHALLVDEPELKIARVNTSFVEGRLSYFDLHHLVGTPQGTEHFVERHEMGLFEREEMEAAFEAAGLEVRYHEHGLTGRGLYLGRAKG